VANIQAQDDRRVVQCTGELYPFVYTGSEEEGFIEVFSLDAP
jgi:hypothetical protein